MSISELLRLLEQPQTHRLLTDRQLQLLPREERFHLQLHRLQPKGLRDHRIVGLRGNLAEGGWLFGQHLPETRLEVLQHLLEGPRPALAVQVGEEGGVGALEEVGELLLAVLEVEEAILVVILVELPEEGPEVPSLASLLVVRAALVGIFGADEGRHVLEDVGLLLVGAVQPTEVEDQEEMEMDLLGGIPLLGHATRGFIFSPLLKLRKSNIIFVRPIPVKIGPTNPKSTTRPLQVWINVQLTLVRPDGRFLTLSRPMHAFPYPAALKIHFPQAHFKIIHFLIRIVI